jgi:hypothetical protein
MLLPNVYLHISLIAINSLPKKVYVFLIELNNYIKRNSISIYVRLLL